MTVSNAELQVMKVIWMKKEATSREVVQVLAQKYSWTTSTIKTLLGRLVEKKCLTTRKSGNKYYYSSILSEEESMLQITEAIENKVCAMQLNQVISNLIMDNPFTEKDLNQMEAMITKKRKTIVPKIDCTCV